jgi:chromate transporter
VSTTTSPADTSNPPESPYRLTDLLTYFLRLGSLGFGGPVALVGYMQRDLVDDRRWISEKDFKEGLALAQLAPGPLAAQLAIYLGWVHHGWIGATLVSFAFILPSFLMVLGLSAFYVSYGGLPWMRGAFYGIGAAVIAVIARSAFKLARTTVGKDPLYRVLFAVSAGVTAWTESELAWLFVLSGVLAWAIRAPRSATMLSAAVLPLGWLITGQSGPAAPETLWKIGWYFAEAGAFVFGSGLAIVPFLHGGVVNDFGWLSEQQFLDAVAVAMITPGPVVITVSFIGYLVAGPLGATIAALGVFLPCYLLVVIPARYFRRAVHDPRVKTFVDGVTVAAAGAIAGAAFVLGRRAVFDWPTLAIAGVTLLLITRMKARYEPLAIVGAGIAGLVLSSGAL